MESTYKRRGRPFPTRASILAREQREQVQDSQEYWLEVLAAQRLHAFTQKEGP